MNITKGAVSAPTKFSMIELAWGGTIEIPVFISKRITIINIRPLGVTLFDYVNYTFNSLCYTKDSPLRGRSLILRKRSTRIDSSLCRNS